MLNKKETSPTTVGKVEVFYFPQLGVSLRVQSINGEPWFVAKDIAESLQYSNPRDAIIKHCREKGVAFYDSLTEGGIQKLKYINEGNMYRLIVNCTLPIADEFEEWIFERVLPSIRKTGMYALPQRRKAVALLPKDRGQKWEQFYTELARYTTREDEELVAGLMNVSRRHVHEVAMGRKPAYGVCCMLVDCAKANRAKGIERMTANRSVDMEELRLELMSAINPQEA